jgi:hypothetical protein
MSISIQTWMKCGVVIVLTACGSSPSPDSLLAAKQNHAGTTAESIDSGGGFSPGNSSSGGGVPSPGTGDDGGGGVPPGTTDGGEGDALSTDGASNSLCFPPATGDFTADGTFTATSGDVTSVSCTIFRPTVLGAGGCLNPVIVWGNGTFNTPQSYTALFNHWATHGFIVAAADTSNSGSGKEMLACLQYMIDQNGAAGSDYQGKVDVNHIASSGYSQGGAGCLEASIDPRFLVTAAVSPFISLPLGGYDTTSVMKQIHPLFMISGGADTVAVPSSNQQPIFMQAPVPIVWATHAGSSHLEVLGAGGAYAGPLTAWFRYKLMNDPAAGQWFEKPPCNLCSASGWSVQFSSMWK